MAISRLSMTMLMTIVTRTKKKVMTQVNTQEI